MQNIGFKGSPRGPALDKWTHPFEEDRAVHLA